MNSKTLSCTSCFELGKTLLIVYKKKILFFIYIHILYITHFLQVVEFLIHTFSKQIDPSRLASENRVVLTWMFLLTATQLSFSLISVFLLIRFELRTQLSFSLISVFLLIRFELRTQEATQLKMELDKAQETIQAAETLVSKLDGEFKRWSGQVGCTITINSRV